MQGRACLTTGCPWCMRQTLSYFNETLNSEYDKNPDDRTVLVLVHDGYALGADKYTKSKRDFQ